VYAARTLMQITIRLLASYRRYLPDDHDDQAGYVHEVGAGTTVADLLVGLPIPKADACTHFVNGRHTERGRVLKEGDVVSVFPAVGGGD
jgi:molybdopterin converting factor small subunit